MLLQKIIRLLLKKCYFDESWYSVSLDDGEITLSDRKLSTYVNALAKAGFVIEQLIEESDDDLMQPQGGNSDFAKKSKDASCNFCNQSKKTIESDNLIPLVKQLPAGSRYLFSTMEFPVS